MMRAKILFIVPGGIHWASSRFRGYWPARYIENSLVLTTDEYKTAQVEADIYYLVKAGDSAFVETAKNTGATVVMDYCDPIWWFSPLEARRIADTVDYMTFSNKALMVDFVKWYGSTSKAVTIPDRLEPTHYKLRKDHGQAEPVRFIWFGASQNRLSIFGAITNLERLCRNGINAELTFCDDAPDDQWSMNMPFPTYYTGWSLEKENQIIAAHDIALLPPYPGPWGKVKSNNKFLTAQACGLPAITGLDYQEMWDLAASMWERDARVQMQAAMYSDYMDVRKSAAEICELVGIPDSIQP